MTNMIEVRDLRKVFPNGVKAVDGVTVSVSEGEIFGLLGPNGAGKSTTIGVLTTLLLPTGGTASVAGVDVVRRPNAARLAIGYVSQDLAVDDSLTGLENLRLQAGIYHLSPDETRQRIAEVLEMVELTDRARDLVDTYSGGMRKRLDIACGLIHRPRVLFLDEPTLGLDIQTRRQIWQYVNRLRSEINMTIFLTTHYMDEADALCDRIAIIDHGHIKAMDTPSALKETLGGASVEFEFSQGSTQDIAGAIAILRPRPFVREIHEMGEQRYRAVVTNGEAAVPSIFDALSDRPVKIGAVSFKQPSLDDVFLHYTGRELRETGGEDAMRSRIMMRRMRS